MDEMMVPGSFVSPLYTVTFKRDDKGPVELTILPGPRIQIREGGFSISMTEVEWDAVKTMAERLLDNIHMGLDEDPE